MAKFGNIEVNFGKVPEGGEPCAGRSADAPDVGAACWAALWARRCKALLRCQLC